MTALSPDPAPENRPVVRLLPKANARAIRHGMPWVYANEVVLDRRTKALAAGTLAVLEDGERRPMGLVAVNPSSKIFCRMLDADTTAVIDKVWFAQHLRHALSMRARLSTQPDTTQ